MSFTRGEGVRVTPTLHERFRGDHDSFPQSWSGTIHQRPDETSVESKDNHVDFETLVSLLHQAQNDIAMLTQDRESLLQQLELVHSSDQGANKNEVISAAARQEIHGLVEENKRLEDEIKELRRWRNDFELQLNQDHYEADYSLKELLDIHQHMEQNIQELQTCISQGSSARAGPNIPQVQSHVSEFWKSLCDQRPHWKKIVIENMQLKKHISDLEEALQMKYAESEISEAHSDGDSVHSSMQNHIIDSSHEKELERYTQLLFEATEKVTQTEKENKELESINSKWKEFGDYLKNENKDLEAQLHQSLDDVQQLENKIEQLTESDQVKDRSEANITDRNKDLENQLKEAQDNIHQLENRLMELLQRDPDRPVVTHRKREEYRNDVAVSEDVDDEERLRTERVVEELASHLSELVLQVEREKAESIDNLTQCSCKDSDGSREDLFLIKQLGESESLIAELKIQVEEVQQELDSQKLRNMVLEAQIPLKQTLPRGFVPLKLTEDASTNTEHSVKPTALYIGGRAARDHHRASFIDVQTLPLETSL